MAMASEKKQKRADSDVARQKKEEQARGARRRSRQWIGVALAILVVVGAVSIVRTVFDAVGSLLDNTAEMTEYENRLRPMVWFDVLPFTDLGQVNQQELKQVALWGIFDSTPTNELRKSEDEQILISAREVDLYAAELFGANFKFTEHGPFEDASMGLIYNFDSETQDYIMPNTSLQPAYTARVMDIVNRSDGIRQVIVGYVSLINTEGAVVNQPDYEHPVLFMDFFFLRSGNAYYLYAMQRNTAYTLPTENASSTTAQSTLVVPESLPDSYTTISIPPQTADSVSDDATGSASLEDGSGSGDESGTGDGSETSDEGDADSADSDGSTGGG